MTEPVRIIVDTREARPWTFEDLGDRVVLERAQLETGDYSVAGLESRVTIERKSLDDLVSTVLRSRERFFREVARMAGMDVRAIVVEASIEDVVRQRYTSAVPPETLLAILAGVSCRGCPVVWAGSRPEAQLWAGHVLLAAAARFGREDALVRAASAADPG